LDWTFGKNWSSNSIGLLDVGYGSAACLGTNGIGQFPKQIDDVSSSWCAYKRKWILTREGDHVPHHRGEVLQLHLLLPLVLKH
jgi:hypothetical protein